MNRLSVSSKEKQKIQEEIQSLVSLQERTVQEQSAAVGQAREIIAGMSWRPIVMLAFALVILSGCSWNRRCCPIVPVCGLLEIGLGDT